MNEHKFYAELREDAKVFKEKVRLHKVPGGPGAAGLCDIVWVCYAGNFWVELKVVEVPKRADTPIWLRKVTTDLQYSNLATGFNFNGMAAMIVGFEWGAKKYARVFSPPEIDKPWYYFPDIYKCVCKPRGAAWDFDKLNELLQGVMKIRWGA